MFLAKGLDSSGCSTKSGFVHLEETLWLQAPFWPSVDLEVFYLCKDSLQAKVSIILSYL